MSTEKVRARVRELAKTLSIEQVAKKMKRTPASIHHFLYYKPAGQQTVKAKTEKRRKWRAYSRKARATLSRPEELGDGRVGKVFSRTNLAPLGKDCSTYTVVVVRAENAGKALLEAAQELL